MDMEECNGLADFKVLFQWWRSLQWSWLWHRVVW